MSARVRKLLAVLLSAGAPVAHGWTQGILQANGTPDPFYVPFHAWFDAANGVNGLGQPRDGTRVVRWVDISGHRRDLVRVDANANRRPTFCAAPGNGEPAAVAFDGDDYLWADKATEFGTVDGEKTVFVVVRVRSADGGYVFDGTASTGRNALFTGQSGAVRRWVAFAGSGSPAVGPNVLNDEFEIHSVVFGATATTHYINGKPVATKAARSGSLAGLVLGSRYTLGHGLLGDVAELLVYDIALSDRNRSLLEGYLRRRHAPRAPLAPPAPIDVFKSGVGYHTYRIPSLLATKASTLLAFCEGRASRSDHAANDIVLKRSTDGGKSWGKLQLLHDDGRNSLNNPCAVQVSQGPNAGRVLLMYQRFPSGCHESCVVAGYSGSRICRSFLIHSDDDGRTWSTPREITRQVKRPTVATSIASGPGIGIEKRRAPHRGRLLIPFNQQGPRGVYQVYAAYSDDGGNTWAYGKIAPSGAAGNGNEVQFVELMNGDVLLNCRSLRGTRHRKTALSKDGGITWTPLVDDQTLVEPQVMASILRWTDPLDGWKKSRILYAGPNSQRGRQNGAVHVSYDEGVTWKRSRIIYPGEYAYSCLAPAGGPWIACLYERDGYQKISLASFTIEWLTDQIDCSGKDSHGKRYGAGCAGINGVPRLDVLGCPTPRTSFRVALSRGRGGSVGLLVFGARRASIPVLGCRLNSVPILAIGPPLSLSASGTNAWTIALPASIRTLTMTLQGLVIDSHAPEGVAFTDGYELRVF